MPAPGPLVSRDGSRCRQTSSSNVYAQSTRLELLVRKPLHSTVTTFQISARGDESFGVKLQLVYVTPAVREYLIVDAVEPEGKVSKEGKIIMPLSYRKPERYYTVTVTPVWGLN